MVFAYNKTQKRILRDAQLHLNNLYKNSMYIANLSYIREIHHAHFFDPDCDTCVVILSQYFHHLMGSLDIDNYYKIRGILDEIDCMVDKKFN